MGKLLRVLIVEDSEDDALLLLRDLRRGGYEPQFERVETAASMKAALDRQTWDIVLSDFSLPHFNAPAALAVLKDSGLDLPFIIVSGTIGEDAAVASLKAGAHDFIVKGSPARLTPAIERELEQAEIRRKQKEAEQAVHQAEKRFRALIENSSDAMVLVDVQGNILFTSPSISRILGYGVSEWEGRNGFDFLHPEELETVRTQFNELLNDGSPTIRVETRLLHSDGSYRWVEMVSSRFDSEPDVTTIVINFRDITDRKNLQVQQERHLQAVEEMRQFLQSTLDAFPANTAVLDRDGTIISVNAPWKRFADENGARSATDYLGANYLTICATATGSTLEEAEPTADGIRAVMEGRRNEFRLEYPCHSPSEKRWFTLRVTPFAEPAPRRVVVAHINVTERKQTEEARQKYSERLQNLHKIDLAILTMQSPETVGESVLEFLQQQLSTARVGITLFDFATQEAHQLATSGGQENPLLAGARFSLAGLPVEMFDRLRGGEKVVIEDLTMLPQTIPIVRLMMAEGLRSAVAIPLKVDNQLVGTLNLGSTTLTPFTPEQIEIAREVADQLAITLQQAHYREQIARHVAELEQRVVERTVELNRTKNRIEAVLNSSSDAIVLTSFDGVIQQVNLAVGNLFGYSVDDLFNQSLITLTAPDSSEMLLEAMGSVFNSMEPRTIEVLARRKDGSIFHGDLALSPVVEDSAIKGVVGILRDMTERKRVEGALRASEEKYRILVESAEAGISTITHDGRFLYMNQYAAQRIHGKPEELIDKTMYDLFPPEAADRQQAAVRKVIESGQGVIVENRSVIMGQQYWFRVSIEPLKDESGVVSSALVVAIDITKLKRAEEALSESEARYRLLFENANAAIMVADENGRYLDVNTEAEALTGYTREELLGMSVTDISPPSIPERGQIMYEEFTKLGQMEGEYIILRKDGTTIEAEFTAAQVSPGRYQSIIRDIAERKQLQRSLEASEGRYRALVEFAPDPIVIVDETGHIALVNGQIKKLTDYEPQELIGQPVEVLLPERFHDRHVAHRTGYMTAPTTRSMGEKLHLVIRHKNGSEIPVTVRLSLIKTGDELLTMAYIVDITAQRQMEEGLRAALAKEKELSELRTRFISMVSHDLRTPLSVIRSSTESLQIYYARLDEEQKTKKFSNIQTQIDRMIGLLNDVLTVTRADAGKIPFHPTLSNLDQICRSLADEFQSAPDMKHTLVYTSPDEPIQVPIDERLLQQAVINLLTNAFKYSPEGGTVHFDLLFEGDSAVIRVKDSGIGIPEADQLHLFDTFHRAGNVGNIQGTGLGLAIVKRSVEAQGGTITFESQVGVGTTFIIRLPAAPRTD